MNITFYSITDDYRKVQKTLGEGVSLNVDMRTDVDVFNPVFMIKNFNRSYNYLQWNDKYYFITGIGYVGKNVWQIETDIDVLMTYKDTILNTTCLVTQSTKENPYFDGGDYLTDSNFEYDIYMSDVTLSDTENNILVTVGKAK